MSAEQIIRHLISEIDLYLGTLSGYGAAAVRTGLSTWKDGPYTPVPAQKTILPQELETALKLLRADGHVSLADAIGDAAGYLKWITYGLYPRDEIGDAFAIGHSFCSIVGENSPVAAMDYDLGLFIIKPDLLYRDHQHAAPELYAPLTGPHGWRFGKGEGLTWKEAHQPVWNQSYQHHATKTGPNPFLCIFGWTSDTHEAPSVIVCDDWDKLEHEMPHK